MAKKTNQNQMTEKEIKDNKDILAELENIDKLLGEDIDVPPTTTKKAQAPKKEKKETTVKSDSKVEIKITADPEVVKSILAKLPDQVQTKHLNDVFEFNDGGKYMRRHLRAKFSEGHEHGQPWVWTKDDKQLLQIVEYFVSTLTNEKKQQLVCVGEDVINGTK